MIPFSSLSGGIAPFNVTELWSIEFRPGYGAFDFWIDNLSFYSEPVLRPRGSVADGRLAKYMESFAGSWKVDRQSSSPGTLARRRAFPTQ